jgi:hypothetical protein
MANPQVRYSESHLTALPKGSMRSSPNDNSIHAPIEGTLKEPKGSKLDAKRRADYQSDVARVDAWDTSVWSTWTVTGRVLPERCDVGVPATVSQGIGAGGRFQLRLEVIRSHIAAVCALEKGGPSVFEIADVVRRRLIPLSQVLPHLAFEERGTRSGAGAGVLREA